MEIKPIVDVKPSLLSKFDCGVEALNAYFRRFAKKNDKLGIGRTYVLIEGAAVLGYYTLSMAHVEFNSIPKQAPSRLPKYPIPAARIGRLAVSVNAQGRGLGEFLLMDALSRCLRVSEEVATFAVIVDAKDQRAKNFYLKYGFLPFEDEKLSLFLPMSTIAKA